MGIHLDDKLIFKYDAINVKEDTSSIRPTESEHTSALQRSRYLMIDNNIDYLRYQYAANLVTKEITNPLTDMKKKNLLNLRYLSTKEVDKRDKGYLCSKVASSPNYKH